MQKTKRQHMVPRCYLARFCKNGQQLYAFDKSTSKSFLTNVENVAQERYFYDMPEDLVAKACPGQQVDVQFVEKSFSKLEGVGNSLIDELVEGVERSAIITRRQRVCLAPYIIFQLLRTRLHRDVMVEMKEKLMQVLADEHVRKNFPGLPEDAYPRVQYNRRLLPIDHARLLFDEDKVVELSAIISQHIWFVGINRTNQPYYTSDHPVAKKANLHRTGRSFNGLRSRGIEIAFPLSSRHLLVMLERSYFQKMQNRDGRAVSMGPVAVERFNSLQVMKCQRQVYCETDHFEQAEGLCRRHPEMCAPDRPRVQVDRTDDVLGFLLSD